MFEQCEIGGKRFAPARFVAPMAGYTHSAFRRLVAELGGCGALWTEMLSARQIINEDFSKSAWVKRREVEKFVVYQLMVRENDPMDRVVSTLLSQGADAIDLNLACDAPQIRSLQAGSALFTDIATMRKIIEQTRKHWKGMLTVKIRLGDRHPQWQQRLEERIKLIQDCGVDAVIVHPRFFEDKFKRSARYDTFDFIASITNLPIIASGDIVGRETVEKNAQKLKPVSAIMLGRIAIIKPWVFAQWDKDFTPDYRGIWQKMFDYIKEDFEPVVALSRIKMFTKYYSANFLFGNIFRNKINNGKNLDEAQKAADEFFDKDPAIVKNPVVENL
ncbi:MAG: tRNA dihydrouridine synthase [Verrucomicrobiia bacterium]